MAPNPRRIGPVGRTTILCLLGLCAGLAMVVTLVLDLRDPESAALELGRNAVPAQVALNRVAAASSNGQELLLAVLQSTDPVAQGTGISAAQIEGRAQDTAWNTYLKLALNLPGERAVQRSYEAASARSVELAASLLAMDATDPSFEAGLADERNEANKLDQALATLQSRFYNAVMRDDAAAIVSGVAAARNNNYLVYGILAVIIAVIGGWLMSSAHRDQRRFTEETAAMRTAAKRADLETSLQRALEMEPTEESSYPVVTQALTIVAPEFPSELLLADSSQAHFRQVLTTASDADSACPVGAPAMCPATMSGQAQLFPDSSNLDTCPYLRGRDTPVWAICTPVSIAGRSTGVIHTQGPLPLPLDDNIDALALIGRKTGEHLGMLRAFSRSETQASTDPLTGLLNRRSLEARVRELDETGLPFVIAYGDLDHFKMLNDVHGHDTGDRALRLFARVLRDNVRPNDIPGRYGGEEFVIVLPDCSVDNATAVVERIRTRLRTSLVLASVPSFTASFGIAGSEPGSTFSQTLDTADQALLRAKRAGRDRIVIAGAEVGDRGPVDVPVDPDTSNNPVALG
jgi:diguanylate cyclase (GGDEF)-like protein